MKKMRKIQTLNLKKEYHGENTGGNVWRVRGYVRKDGTYPRTFFLVSCKAKKSIAQLILISRKIRPYY